MLSMSRNFEIAWKILDGSKAVEFLRDNSTIRATCQRQAGTWVDNLRYGWNFQGLRMEHMRFCYVPMSP